MAYVQAFCLDVMSLKASWVVEWFEGFHMDTGYSNAGELIDSKYTGPVLQYCIFIDCMHSYYVKITVTMSI